MWKIIVGLFIIFGESIIYTVPDSQPFVGLGVFLLALYLCISGVTEEFELEKPKKGDSDGND